MLSARCTHPIRKGQYRRLIKLRTHQHSPPTTGTRHETSHDGLIAASITGLNLGQRQVAEVWRWSLCQHCGEPGIFCCCNCQKFGICLSLIIKWYTIWLHLNIDKFILFVYIKWPYINRKSGDLMYFFGAVGIKPLKTVEDCHHPSWSGSTLVLHWAAYPIVGEDQSARLGFGPYPCVEKHLNFSQRSRSLVNSSCGVGIFPEQVLPSGSAISGYWNSQTSWPFSTLDSIVKLPRRDTWLPVLPADAEARRASPEAQMPNSPRIRCWQHLAMVKSVFAIFLYLGASVYIYIYIICVCVRVCKYI